MIKNCAAFKKVFTHLLFYLHVWNKWVNLSAKNTVLLFAFIKFLKVLLPKMGDNVPFITKTRNVVNNFVQMPGFCPTYLQSRLSSPSSFVWLQRRLLTRPSDTKVNSHTHGQNGWVYTRGLTSRSLTSCFHTCNDKKRELCVELRWCQSSRGGLTSAWWEEIFVLAEETKQKSYQRVRVT